MRNQDKGRTNNPDVVWIMQHAFKYGYDHALGGIYNRGFDDQPTTDTDKVWWSQAEMMAALTDGIRHKKNAAYR